MKLKIAIQKKGRLSEKSISLLKECGISISNGNNKLKTTAGNFPLEVLFLRDDDIPQYVQDGVAHIGIVGENVIKEKKKKVAEVMPLGFGKCRLSLAIRREETYTNPTFFEGKRIATSYPVILGTYLEQKGISAEIEELSGSVEIAPGIGLADGVCDIVSTGSTLLQNGLKEVEEVMRSQSILISNNELDQNLKVLLNRLTFRIKAVLNSRQNKYILLNAPEDRIEQIKGLLPGMKSPTVLPLAQKGWVSLHSVIKEDDFWEVIDELQKVGAEGILVVPIEKMVV